MKARINIELTCEECNGRMNYHDESKHVRCNGLKCSQRGKLFESPTVTLEPVADKEADAKKAATVAKRQATIAANKAAKEAELLTDGEAYVDNSAAG